MPTQEKIKTHSANNRKPENAIEQEPFDEVLMQKATMFLMRVSTAAGAIIETDTRS